MCREIERLIDEGVRRRIFPGAVAAVLKGGEELIVARGRRAVIPDEEPMTLDTIFDLASLTKVVVTATLFATAVAEGIVRPEEEVSALLPEFSRRGITLLQLATHTSGLPAWKPLYELSSPEEAIGYLAGIRPEKPPGKAVIYSCLGYILLGKALEQAWGKRLDQIAREMIFEPLGMSETLFNPPPSLRNRCAPTESGRSLARRRPGYIRSGAQSDPDWVIRGEVHDENAFFLGGVSGNAGLFSTISDLIAFCRALIEGELSGERMEMISRPYTEGLNERRGIGWMIMPDGSLYHTGFTGTSIRICPKRKLAGILLSNRVHPHASGYTSLGIREIRDRFYAQVFGER